MFYRLAIFCLGIYLRLFYRLKVTGSENMPRTGGVVLCANHASNIDPVALAVASKRPVHFMAKKELFQKKFGAYWLRQLNAFPVDRQSADMATYKSAISLLETGRVLGIFAQGTRSSEVEIKGAKTGAAFFALKAQATIVPVKISSDYKLFSRVSVRIGQPISLESYKNQKIKTGMLNEITENIMEKIKEMP